MRRFSSLKYAPAETRRILRDRFARYLPSQHSTSSRTPKGVTLPDEVLLQLLLSLTIDFESDIARARVTYAAALLQIRASQVWMSWPRTDGFARSGDESQRHLKLSVRLARRPTEP